MFAPGDPALVEYQQLQRAFGSNAVVLLVYRDPELMTPEGLERNRRISKRVREVPGVRGVLSPSRLNQALKIIRPSTPLSGTSQTSSPPLLDEDDPVAGELERLFRGYTHSIDRRSGAAVAILETDDRETTIERLDEIAAVLPAPLGRGSLVGEPVLLHEGFDLIERDGATLATWTVSLLGVVLLVSLRSVRFVLLALLTILWSDTVTRAAMVWSGIQLSLVSTILIAVVAVIAVAAVLHLGVRWKSLRRRQHRPRVAAAMTAALLAAPIAWACVTDAAGFASLLVSRIVPVRQFGVMIAVAAMLVLAALGLFAPAALAAGGTAPAPRRGSRRHHPRMGVAMFRAADRTIQKMSLRLARAGVRWRRAIAAPIVVVTGLAIVGTVRLPTETSFLNNFEADSPIVAAYDRVERDFGGAGVWDVILDAPDRLSEDYLSRVLALESDLRSVDVRGEGLSKVLSLADVDAAAGQVPLLGFAPPPMRLVGMRSAMPVFSDALMSPPDAEGPRKMRIMLRSREQLPAETKLDLIDEVERVVAEHTGKPAWRKAVGGESEGDAATETDVIVTGYYVMMSRLVAGLVADQWRCFAVAVAAVWVLLGIATRSLRLATVALLPNLVPVFVVLAIAGLLGGKLNMGAAMIAAVSIGLSIDGSVHFFAAYRRHRRRDHPPESAAVHAAGAIGLPVVLATLALVVGFSVIATSRFVPTATFGTLVATTLAVGTLVNLTALPAAVAWVDSERG